MVGELVRRIDGSSIAVDIDIVDTDIDLTPAAPTWTTASRCWIVPFHTAEGPR
jgi:hypothetical protein